jgi:hypothetical protein
MPSIGGPFEILPLPDCAQAGASKAQIANISLSKRKIVIFTVAVSPSFVKTPQAFQQPLNRILSAKKHWREKSSIKALTPE